MEVERQCEVDGRLDVVLYGFELRLQELEHEAGKRRPVKRDFVLALLFHASFEVGSIAFELRRIDLFHPREQHVYFYYTRSLYCG